MHTVAALLTSSTEGNRVLFTENHDQASNQNGGRIPAQVDPGGNPNTPSYWAVKKAMMGIAAICVAPGIPMILQGQEMLTYADFAFPIPPQLDWSLATTNAGLVQEVADLFHLRSNANGDSSGLSGSVATTLQVVSNATQKVAVIYRANANPLVQGAKGTHFLAVINMYDNPISNFVLTNVPVDGTWSVRFNGDLTKYSSQFGNYAASQTAVIISNGSASIKIPAYSVLLLSL